MWMLAEEAGGHIWVDLKKTRNEEGPDSIEEQKHIEWFEKETILEKKQKG